MYSRLALAIAIGCLLPLSGCSAIIGDDDPLGLETETPVSSDGETAQPPDSDGPATAKPAADDTAASGSEEAVGDGVSFDAEAVQSAHLDTLGSAGDFTTQRSIITHNESVTRYSNETYAIDLHGPALVVVNRTIVRTDEVTDRPVTVRFTEATATYEQQVTWDDAELDVEYRQDSDPDTDVEPVDRTAAAKLDARTLAVIDAATWEQIEEGEVEGVEATRYDASTEELDVVGYEDVDATLILGDDGVVRYVSYRFVRAADGDRTEYRYEAGYFAVGETSIERPEWVDRLRNE